MRSISTRPPLTPPVLHDEIVNCTQAELSVFQPPQGQTCQQWAGEFVQAVGAGYLGAQGTLERADLRSESQRHEQLRLLCVRTRERSG